MNPSRLRQPSRTIKEQLSWHPRVPKTLAVEADEDLTDPAIPAVEEDDPWTSGPQNATANYQPTDGAQTAQSGNDQPEAVHIEDFDNAEISDIDKSYNDYLPPLDLDGGISGDNEIFLDDIDNVDEWDEPEPLAKANSELNERLYPPDNDLTGLSRVLKINELISRIKPITDEQRMRIATLLGEFSINRLQSRLPWLCKQDWSGRSLLLFLQFRNIWDSNCSRRWWEYSFWHPGLECWYPTYSRNNLAWDATYGLIQQRLRCAPDEVINEDWFDEWNSLALWARGFPSFASFAVLRARFGDTEEWREYIDPHNNRNERNPIYPTYSYFSKSILDITEETDLKCLLSKSRDFRIFTPEQKLLLAIVETALVDYRRLKEETTERNRSSTQQRFQEVKNWFLSDDIEKFTSFENICDIFDIDSSFIKKIIRLASLADATNDIKKRNYL